MSTESETVDTTLAAEEFSTYQDITYTSRSIPNRATNVSPADFGRNLEENGYTKSVSKNGDVTIFKKGDMKYTVRGSSNSKDGKLVRKIRLETEPQ